MKRALEISASFTGVIPTGSYQNEKPFFSVKETVELDLEVMTELDDTYVSNRQKQLHEICYKKFKKQAEVAYQEYIAKTYQNIRFYDGKDGKKYPSVTSIINMDKDFHIPPDELKQYGSRGSLLHKQAEIFLTTGVWKEPKDIAESSFDYLTVVKGSLGLEFEDVDFKGFYAEYPFKIIELEKTTINDDYQYGGRIDIIGIIESANKGKWDKVEGSIFDEPIMLDIKTSTTLDKLIGFTQLSAYCKSENIKQMGLIHLTKE